MQVKHVVLRTFDECPSYLKNKIIDKYKDINVDVGDWYETILKDWTKKLTKVGYFNADIQFSIGEGACFTADLHMPTLLKHYKAATKDMKVFKGLKGKVEGTICRINNRYCHSYSCEPDVDGLNLTFEQERLLKEFKNWLNKDYHFFAYEIYKQLFAEWEWRLSKKSVISTLKINGYLFNESGEIDS